LAFFIAFLSFNSVAVFLALTLDADDNGTPEDVDTVLTEETAGEDTRGVYTTRGGEDTRRERTMRGADTGFL
jgi:hypothetical protein